MKNKSKVQKIVNSYLIANEKTEESILTAVLLSPKLKPRDKEILLLLFHIAYKPKQFISLDDEVVKVTLSEIEEIGIALKQTSSLVFRKLHKLKVIEWDKKKHLVKLNYSWAKDEIELMNGRLESFYKLLLNQI
jgi:hypothetical protein